MKSTFRKCWKTLMACLLALGLLAGTAAAEQTGTEPYYLSDDLFTSRDLEQTADTAGAETITVSDGSDVRITRAGTYVLSGSASGVTVYVEAGDEDKVQLVLSGLTVTNQDFPCIYVVSADKVFVTTAADSTLSVTGTFRADGSTHTDGVIFSRDDLVLGGTAVLNIVSPDNGVVCKDDLKITGGTYVIQASSKAIEANDSIRIAGGTFRLTAGTDGLHAENDEDASMGYVYIGGGSLTIQAGDDGIHATSVLQIDDGILEITAGEGLESTMIQVNGGTININSADDGINAARKSPSYTPAVIFNGGETTITMGRGDTDGVDSNGNIYVYGGIVSVNGNSTFDYDGTGLISGGTVYSNGQLVSSLPNQMMGGGGRGGFGGGPGGFGGGWGGRGR